MINKKKNAEIESLELRLNTVSVRSLKVERAFNFKVRRA